MVGLFVPSPYLIKRRAEQSALVEIANLAHEPRFPRNHFSCRRDTHKVAMTCALKATLARRKDSSPPKCNKQMTWAATCDVHGHRPYAFSKKLDVFIVQYIERGEEGGQGEFWWKNDVHIHKLWTKFIWFDCHSYLWWANFSMDNWFSYIFTGSGWAGMICEGFKINNRDTSTTPAWTSWNLVELMFVFWLFWSLTLPFQHSFHIKKQCQKKYHVYIISI